MMWCSITYMGASSRRKAQPRQRFKKRRRIVRKHAFGEFNGDLRRADARLADNIASLRQFGIADQVDKQLGAKKLAIYLPSAHRV